MNEFNLLFADSLTTYYKKQIILNKYQFESLENIKDELKNDKDSWNSYMKKLFPDGTSFLINPLPPAPATTHTAPIIGLLDINGYGRLTINYDANTIINTISYDTKNLPSLDISPDEWGDIIPYIIIKMCMSGIPFFYRKLLKIPNAGMLNHKDYNMLCAQNGMFGTALNNACKINNTNKACACFSTYTNHTDKQKKMAENLLKFDPSLIDNPWCIYPQCASGKAYKPYNLKNNSVCPNITYSNLTIDPADYSNISLKDINLASSFTNKIGFELGCSGSYTYDGKNLKCNNETIENYSLNNKPSNIFENYKNKNKNKYNKYNCIYNIILLILALLFIVFLYIFYMYKYNKNKECIIITTILFVSGITIMIILLTLTIKKYLKSLKQEKFNYENYIQSNNTNNCKIGYVIQQDGKCILGDENSICNTLWYLPESNMTGKYYYAGTFDNGTIIVLGENANFISLQDGSWVKIAEMPSQTGLDLTKTTPYGGTDSIPSSNISISGNILVIYNINNIMIYNLISNEWKKILLENIPQEALSINTISDNESIVILINNMLYVFGGKIYKDENVFIQNVLIYNLSDLDNINITVSSRIADSINFSKRGKCYYDSIKNMIYVLSYDTTISSYYYFIEYNIDNPEDIIHKIKNVNIEITADNVVSKYKDGSGLYGFFGFNVSGFTDINTGVTTPYEIVYNNIFVDSSFSQIWSTFELNGFIFMITANGELYRGIIDYNNKKFIVSPCLGVDNFQYSL